MLPVLLLPTRIHTAFRLHTERGEEDEKEQEAAAAEGAEQTCCR